MYVYLHIYVYINYGHHDLLAGKFDLYMSTLTKKIIIKWLFFVQEIYRTFLTLPNWLGSLIVIPLLKGIPFGIQNIHPERYHQSKTKVFLLYKIKDS